ncbi:MAG: 50S ribosomal protein L10 [Candidatus Paceibacterota bacterium]
MKTFQQKKEGLSKVKDKLSKSKITVFTTFSREGEKGLSVVDMRTFKKGLKDVEAEYLVEKKTLVDKALKDDKKDVDVFQFNGSMGVVFGYGDEATVAKSIYNFSKSNPALHFFGALFNDQFIDADKFSELAKLPSRDVMLGRTLGMMKYPLSGLVNVLQGNMRNLVLILANIKK